MKLFLSWSGPTSKAIAEHFREWLPMLLQHVEPYISSSDTDKGARWANDIAVELKESNFGLIFITPDNLKAPWIMFEAGALAKAVDLARVMPVLFGVTQSELRDSPLVQFQMTAFESAEVRKLLHSINKNNSAHKLTDQRLNTLFDVLWPDCEKHIADICSRAKPPPNEGKKDSNFEVRQSVEELVVNTRDILKRLTAQEQAWSGRQSSHQPIHRLERNALEKTLKESQGLVHAISDLKREIEIELCPGAEVDQALPAILTNLAKVEREASEHLKNVARMRNRILQIDD